MRRRLVRGLSALTLAVAGLVMGATGAGATATSTGSEWVAGPASSGEMTAAVTKLTHTDAANRLRAAGITWSSSGNCSDWNNSTCTSFTQINLATIQGAITLKNASGCALRVTGGTEVGHASGTYSHRNGYKLDFALSTCLTNYITGTFTSIGGSKWQSGSGNIYYRESNHWDVTYYNCGGC